MRLDSARELQAELRETLGLQGVRALGVLGSHPEAGGLPVPIVPPPAVGIAPVGRGEYRLAVQVQRTGPRTERMVGHIIERSSGEVDVLRVGRIRIQGGAPLQRARVRPLRVGASIGHPGALTGTLGAFLEIDEGPLAVLSNHHVLAPLNAGVDGDAILQPGSTDGGDVDRDRVGALLRAIPLGVQEHSVMDAGAARLEASVEVEPSSDGWLRGVVPEGDDAFDSLGERQAVDKRGRTTGLTQGQLVSLELNGLEIDYPGLGAVTFDRVISVQGAERPFSDRGDSGSLVRTSDSRLALGLLFAGFVRGGPSGTGLSYANPIGPILARLNASFVEE